MLPPEIAARGREFVQSPAGQALFDFALQSCPTLELGKVDLESFNASLLIERGWRSALRFVIASVQVPEPYDDMSATRPIENTTD
jgi:hypothetical protein